MPNVTVRNKQFPVNAALPGGFDANVMPDTPVTLTAVPTISQASPTQPGVQLTYNFLFWNVKDSQESAVSKNQTVTKQVGNSAVTASAWYYQTGPGGGSGIGVWAFSEVQDMILAASPIEQTVPATAQLGPNSVSNAVAVAIHALQTIGTEVFDTWSVFGDGTPAGRILSVPKSGSTWGIANYRAPATQQPHIDPDLGDILVAVQGIKDKLKWVADPSPEDWIRIQEKIRRGEVRGLGAAIDELSDTLKNLGALSRPELEVKLVDLRAQMTRLDAARRAIENALKGGR